EQERNLTGPGPDLSHADTRGLACQARGKVDQGRDLGFMNQARDDGFALTSARSAVTARNYWIIPCPESSPAKLALTCITAPHWSAVRPLGQIILARDDAVPAVKAALKRLANGDGCGIDHRRRQPDALE